MTMPTIPHAWFHVGALTLLLASCAGDDPRSGGFFGGLVGLGSGAYQQRVADETAALDAEERRHQEAVEGRATLDAAVQERRAEARDLKRQVATLRNDIGALDADIAALQQEETRTRDGVARAEADVASLLDDIDRIEATQKAHDEAKALGADAGPDADPAQFGEPPREQISDLRAYINKLQAAVDALKTARATHGNETAPGVVDEAK